ncbi:MAG: type II toxin-antitoxin system MqsA family antitoxin [Verrucomicrobiota bacterium]
MKAIPSTTKAGAPSPASLKAKKEALERGERPPARVFRIAKRADGTLARVAVNPELQRARSAKTWAAKSEVAKVRHSLDLTQEAFAALLGVGLSTLRSWEQHKREPSGAARMLITIALRHPEVLQEAVA